MECFLFVFTATVLPTISLLAGMLSQWRHQRQVAKREQQEAVERLRLPATHDELTGLPSRLHVQQWLRSAAARAAAQRASAWAASIDGDRFQQWPMPCCTGPSTSVATRS